MKASEYRDMSRDELQQKLLELQQGQFNLRFQHVTGQLENTAQLQKTRKDISRILTILREMDQKKTA
jgi:large subunit ribosomal protein L29